jgi:DNA-binding NarL/FixJ family response regulator
LRVEVWVDTDLHPRVDPGRGLERPGAGIRYGSKHRRAHSGWDSLTATEIKIAAFVEEGLFNPEIAARLLLSRRTVAPHVSHILKKLYVNSRMDIARESAPRP